MNGSGRSIEIKYKGVTIHINLSWRILHIILTMLSHLVRSILCGEQQVVTQLGCICGAPPATPHGPRQKVVIGSLIQG